MSQNRAETGTTYPRSSPGIILSLLDHADRENCINSFRIGWYFRFCDQIVSSYLLVSCYGNYQIRQVTKKDLKAIVV